MKTLSLLVKRLLLGLAFIGVVGASAAEASVFLGNFCWTSSFGDVIQLGVTDMGGGQFLLLGRSTFGSQVDAVNGNAEVVGSQVLMTVSFSGADATESWSGTARVVLNLATLNGTIEAMGLDHEMSIPDSVFTFYDAGTVTPTACP